MYARKKVHYASTAQNHNLRQKVQRFVTADRDIRAVMKDIHLIEAALDTDRTVVSLEKEARRLFAGLAKHARYLKNVIWVNPANDSEKPIAWLEGGANPEEQRMLGFWSESNN